MTNLLEVGLTNAVLSAILAIAVLILTRFWKNPHLAHALWLVVLLKLVTPPFVSVPIHSEIASHSIDSAPTKPEELRVAEWAATSDHSPTGNLPTESTEAVAEHREAVSQSGLNREAAGQANVRPSDDLRAGHRSRFYVGLSWLIGSLACGLIACARIVKFHRTVNGAELADETLRRLGSSVARRLGLKRCPRLLVTSCRLSPMVWPVGSPPTVVLPSDLVEELDDEQLRAIVAHEFGHVARGDCWVRWFEVLCTVLYWWNPCIWLVRREIRVAEELCTDALVVASHPGCSLAFGESLLKADDFLASIPLDAPLLASEMRGGGQLRRRIELIVNGEMPARLSRTTKLAVLILAVVILPLSAQESRPEQQTSSLPNATDNDVKSVTIADIVHGLKAREQAVETLTVNCHTESTHNFVKRGGQMPEGMIEDDAVSMTRSGEVAWEMTRDGRGRMEAKYKKANVRSDGSKKEKREEFFSTFDGTKGQFLTVVSTLDGVVIQRHQRPSETFTRTSRFPFDFTTQHHGDSISSLITQRHGKVIDIREWEDRPVVVVKVAPVTVREDYIYQQQFWIDPTRNYLVVRRQSYVQRGEGKPWGLHFQIDALKHAEVRPRIWLPKVVDIWNYHVTELGQDFLVSREHIEASNWSVNEALDAFRFELPPESINSIGEPIVAREPSNNKSSDQPQSKKVADAEVAAPDSRKMLLKTVDSEGNAVPQTRIHVNALGNAITNRDYLTDEQGLVTVLVPSPHRSVKIWAQKAGFVPLFAYWRPEYQGDGGKAPAEFTFRLPVGTEIGGIIQDDQGMPIEGAVVEVALGNFVDEMNRRPVPNIWLAEAAGPGNNPCITDADGRWSLDNVPAGSEVFVRLKITHPEFVGDTNWGGLQEEQSVQMQALRDKTATIELHRRVAPSAEIINPTVEPSPTGP